MTTALATIAAFEPENLDQALALATRLAESNLLPKALQKRPSDVLVVMMMGRDLGLTSMQSIRQVHVIDGRPSMSAEMMVALCLQRPDVCEFFSLVESTDAKATYKTKRKGAEPVSMSYTIEQAAKAKLTGKQNWQNHTAAMLRARASSSLARVVYPDLTNGIISEDESDEIVVPQAGAVSPPPPARPGAAAAAKDVTPPQAAKKAAPAPKAKPAAAQPIEDAQPADAEPAHDPQTGEVQTQQAEQQPAAGVPWDAEAEVEATRDALMARVTEAPSIEALKALVPEIQQLPEAMREQVRGVYGVRQAALKSGAAPANREPGQEG